MKRFTCPKCGNQESDKGFYIQHRHNQGDDKLYVKCHRCDYNWSEACLDWEPSLEKEE